MILDNARIHHAKLLQPFLEENSLLLRSIEERVVREVRGKGKGEQKVLASKM